MSMKVFIAWSGGRSRQVAFALRDWLQPVIQSIQPFMSERDISAGERGLNVLGAELKEVNFGIICVTPENQEGRWINFEAGAIGKAVDVARVIPYLLGMKGSQLLQPLAQFNWVTADKEGTRKLLNSINQSEHERPLPEKTLAGTFEHWWPTLQPLLDDAATRAASGQGG
jgi:hypothetical protein